MKAFPPIALAILVLAAWTDLAISRSALAHAGIDEELRRADARIAAHPRDAALALRRGELHRFRGDFVAARADYERARRLDPDLAAVDLCLGKSLLAQRRPKEALRALDQFLAREPGHAGALAARGRARMALGDPAAAAMDLTRAIDGLREGDPSPPDLYLDRARAIASLGEGRLAEAIQGLDDGIARLGDPVALELYAIELEVRRRRVDAALARLDRIAARSPRKEAWLARRGRILDDAGRREEARRAYALALARMDERPGSRRDARATLRLESEIRAALTRLAAPGPRREARAP